MVGVIVAEDFEIEALSRDLSEKYGEINFTSEAYPFDFTDYYADEMGDNLYRSWLVFSELFSAERIVERKNFCLRLEEKYSSPDQNRRVNLDPGYLAGAKFVLSSRKNNAQRIYLGEGVFAEITLIYRNNDWRELSWTYPEFSGDKSGKWLQKARRLWLEKRN